MPTLNWIGKEAVINHHNDVPFRTLDKKYTFGNDASDNKIIHGDNLEALKALLPEYEGRIKCIYIDPPYNTGNENWVYNDNVNSPKIRKWLGQVVGKEAEDLTRHDKWLCMMYPRLKLLQKLLSDDGAIFISIDDNEQANLKLICDEIFGAGNFVENYFWESTFRPDNSSPIFRRNAEHIICYAKNKINIKYFKGVKSKTEGMPSLTKAKEKWKQIRFPANVVKTFLADGVYSKGMKDNGNNPQWELVDDIEVKDGIIITEVILNGHSYWATQEKVISELQMGTEIWIKSDSFVPYYKKSKESVGRPTKLLDKNITNDYLYANVEMENIFGKKVFNNPKPTTLVSFLCDFLDDNNSIILDSFAGSGTTAHAVLNLNKQDCGNRKFILVEMEDYAENITAERVRRVINGYGDGKNAVEGTGGSFSFYELGEPVFNGDGYLNENIGTEKLREYIWYSETRTPYATTDNAHPYFMGNHNGTAYYFYYEKERITTLDKAFLNTITSKAEQYVVYADNCLLTPEFMNHNHIVFKKIPRDIKKI